LVQLGEELRGVCAGKILYFGSCGVLDIPKREVEAFRRTTKARCVVGYVEDVGWYAIAAFELALLEALTYYRRADAVEAWLANQYPGLARKLGFRMY
jgi:hypothetical protein